MLLALAGWGAAGACCHQVSRQHGKVSHVQLQQVSVPCINQTLWGQVKRGETRRIVQFHIGSLLEISVICKALLRVFSLL
jgi:hypothetical protein